MGVPALDFELHAKQSVAFTSPATEILYGGAAGGGKSHLMRIAAIMWAVEISGLQVYLFRRIREDLIKNHIEGPHGFRAVLAQWILAGICDIVGDEIRFNTGSKIYLCHCKDEKDRFKYLGAEIHLLLIDELTHFTEVIYRLLRSRVRMVGIKLPPKYEGRFPRIICGSNPGGVGHTWVKSTFVDGVQPSTMRWVSKSQGGMLRQFIQAKLDDNPSMLKDSPDYIDKLEGLGSVALVKAMRDGDWEIVEGAFFDCWSREKHVIEPFAIPEHWYVFRSMDWGSAKPFSVGWWAVPTDDFQLLDGRVIPRGALVRYREWYGAPKDENGVSIPNVGVKMFAEEVGKGILEREKGDGVKYGVLDPSAFAEDGGPSIHDRMKGVYFKRADNKRVPLRGAMGGWDQMRSRLIGDGDGRPMIYCFNTCLDSIRTIPALQHDTNRPEDLDTDMEDHAADEWRYACMSRPYVRGQKVAPRKKDRWDKAFDKISETGSYPFPT